MTDLNNSNDDEERPNDASHGGGSPMDDLDAAWAEFADSHADDLKAVERSGGSKSLGALNHAREIIEDGHLFGIHIEGTRSPDGRLYKGHTGAARLAFETGCPIIPAAIIGSRELQKPGQVIPNKGKSKVIYGKPIEVEKKSADQITHDDLRSLTDRVTREIQKMSGQEYVDEYAQKVKAELKAQQAAEEAEK